MNQVLFNHLKRLNMVILIMEAQGAWHMAELLRKEANMFRKLLESKGEKSC